MALTPYRKAAKAALMSWPPYLSEEEATERVERESFEELESNIGATKSINSAVNAIAQICELTKEETERFRQAVFAKDHAEVTKEDKKVFTNVAKKAIGFEEKSILYVLSEIHDGWVADNASKFNNPKRVERKYQHLPLELIGFKEATADLLFVRPIFEALGVEVNEEALKSAYDLSVEKFLQDKHIHSREGLANYIYKSEYKPLTDENKPKSQEEANLMAGQVAEKNVIVKDYFSKTLG